MLLQLDCCGAKADAIAVGGRASSQQRIAGKAIVAVFVCGNSARDDTSASALSAAQPPHESRYGRFGLYAEAGQCLIAQDAFVPAKQARHLRNELGGFHDESSSASRRTPFSAL
jgi:hypothetical protein